MPSSIFAQVQYISKLMDLFQTAKYEFEVFTYNRSTNYIVNDEDNEVGSVDVTYNWDDRNDDWWGDYTNYENLVLTCGAQGGRPEPTFVWYIENNQVTRDSFVVWPIKKLP